MFLRRFISIFVVFAFFSFSFIACDDDSPTGSNNNDNPPTINQSDFRTVQIPTHMQNAASTNQGAATAVSYINLANSYSSYGSFFTPPQGATLQKPAGTQDDEWVYTWTYEGLTLKLVITETDNYINYKYVFDGSDQYNTYDNYVWLEYMAYKDVAEGWLKIYNQNGENINNVLWEYLWQVSDNDVFIFDMILYNDDGSEDYTVELTSNPDISGSLYIDIMGSGYWTMNWDSDGYGSWEQYDENNNQLGNGSW